MDGKIHKGRISMLRRTIFIISHLLAVAAAFHCNIRYMEKCTPSAMSPAKGPKNNGFRPRGRSRDSACHKPRKSRLRSIHFDDFSELTKETNSHGDDDELPVAQRSFPMLRRALSSPPVSYPPRVASDLLRKFSSSGFTNDNDVVQFSAGFIDREEVLSEILIRDFGWGALDAHRARAGVMALLRSAAGSRGDDAPRGRGRALHEARPLEDGRAAEGDRDAQRATSIPAASPALPAPSPVPTNGSENETKSEMEVENSITKSEQTLWKSVLVNDRAKIRRGGAKIREGKDGGATASVQKDSYSYGLMKAGDNRDARAYGTLYAELDRFWSHMTVPQASATSDPTIREQTARVYMNHARLFLGWVVDARGVLSEGNSLGELLANSEEGGCGEEEPSAPLPLTSASSTAETAKSVRANVWKNVLERTSTASTSDPESQENTKKRISLCDIFPTPRAESTAPILQYVLWLRSERSISANYEANILRGLIRLVKFRFAHEMSGTDSRPVARGRSTPLDDLPIVIELRRLHREAGNKGKKAPRSSDEGKKWLEWSEYLEVIRLLKRDLNDMIASYEERLEPEEKGRDGVSGKPKLSRAEMNSLRVRRKDIAVAFQHYLILSFFACVPDRQRTYRELQLGKSFIRVEGDGDGGGDAPVWVIKHTAEDYKTGATYGERPPLPLTASLTPDVDDFLDRWRPALVRDPPAGADAPGRSSPPTAFLFLQPRTGNPLTANSVYQIVSRCCYRYKRKKTNPHLLRDMIVTHVRKNADASEKELEALALFMGHSMQMQRESYDRRTLEQKVSPAVELMRSMNSLGGGDDVADRS